VVVAGSAIVTRDEEVMLVRDRRPCRYVRVSREDSVGNNHFSHQAVLERKATDDDSVHPPVIPFDWTDLEAVGSLVAAGRCGSSRGHIALHAADSF
jgi:hypothetical protein